MGMHFYSGGRYPVLRSLAILYLIGAALTIAAGIYAIWWSLARFHDTVDRLVLVAGACAATFITVVTMLAIAEVLKLVIDIEHNTRVAATRSFEGARSATRVTGTGNGGQIEDADLREETAEAALIRGH